MELLSNQFDVRTIRKALSLSIEGLARALDVSSRTISRWEHEQNSPQPRHLVKLKEFVAEKQPTLHWTR